MQERYTYIQSVLKSGDDLVQSGNLGGDSVIKRTDEINSAYWTNLLDLSGLSRTRFLEFFDYYQVCGYRI